MARRAGYWREYVRPEFRLLAAMQRRYGPHQLDENGEAVPVRGGGESKPNRRTIERETTRIRREATGS